MLRRTSINSNSKLDVRNIDAKLEARADTLGVDKVVFRRRDDLSMPQIQKREPGTLGLKTIIHAIAHVHPHKAGKAADAASQTQNNGSP